jgi:hypothetical protein
MAHDPGLEIGHKKIARRITSQAKTCNHETFGRQKECARVVRRWLADFVVSCFDNGSEQQGLATADRALTQAECVPMVAMTLYEKWRTFLQNRLRNALRRADAGVGKS